MNGLSNAEVPSTYIWRPAMRQQIILDRKTNQLLNELAKSRGCNRSRVVCEAILVYADREANLEKVESDPKFIEMMKKSAADNKAARVFSQKEAKRYVASKRKQ
jgi:phospholipid N-methyltransferase